MPAKLEKTPCVKCGALLQFYWLKDGVCNACRGCLVVVAVVNKPKGLK